MRLSLLSAGYRAATVFVDDYERHAADADKELREFQDEFVAIEHLLLALLRRRQSFLDHEDAGFGRASLIKAIKELRGGTKVTDQNARSKI